MIKLIAEFDEEVQSGKENVHSYQVTEFFLIIFLVRQQVALDF